MTLIDVAPVGILLSLGGFALAILGVVAALTVAIVFAVRAVRKNKAAKEK